MSIEPRVELLFHPTDLNPLDLARSGQFLGSPAQSLEAALASARLMMIDRMKVELAATTGVQFETETLVRIADLAWQFVFPKFRKISAPSITDAYVRAYARANAGDVPIQLVYDLADRHADKIGEYFHDSSKGAMVEGFNSYVNRRMAGKAAADRVIDAFGLTPRQMRGYTAATASMEGKVNSTQKRSLKGKVRDYIFRSFRNRIRKFSEQEEHNIDQQAQQFAWMWLVEKGRLSPLSEKVWITAKDEKVCKICGPLHGQRVGVSEQFETSKGNLWTPGVHPNCRCFVRLIENTFTVQKAYEHGQWVSREHPRGQGGRFTDKPKLTTLQRTAPADLEWMQQMRALARADVTEAETQAAPKLTTPTLTATQGLTGTGRLSAAPGLSAAPALTAKPETQALTETKALTAPKALTTTGLTVESLLQANPALTVEHLTQSSLSFKEAVDLVTQAKTQPLTKPSQKLTTRGMVRTADVYDIPGDPQSGENLLYHYDPLGEVSAEGRKVQFSTEHEWLKGNEGRAEIFARMQRDLNETIKNTVDDVLTGDYEAWSGTGTTPEGEKFVALTSKEGTKFDLTSSDLTQLITDVAYKKDPGPMTVSVYVVNRGGQADPGYAEIPVQEVLDTLNLKPGQFEQTVYVTGRAHSEQALPTQSGSRYGLETWVNTGDFETTHTNFGAKNQGSAKVVNIEPIEEITLHTTD